MRPRLRIWLLGEFRLVYDDAPLTTVNTPRLQSLLTYLLLHRHTAQARNHLAFALWPDLPETRARANLRRQLHQLQQVLPTADQFIKADTQTLQWRPAGSFTLDVAEFEQAASQVHSRTDLQHAVEVYRGDLLPGCYDDWIITERERLKQTYIEALEGLLQLTTTDGDYASALQQAQRLLQIDPLREEIHRRVINLHALSNDRAAALRAYHVCASTLQRELGVEPGPATRDIYERLLSLEAAATPLEATFPLIGRDHEWTQLKAAWRRACAGQAQLAVLIGEAGIGKTRLADELFTRIKRQDFNALIAPCYAAEGALAYAPIVAWLRARPTPALERVWLCEVARLLPEILIQHPELPAPGPLTEAWQRQRLHEALARAMLSHGEPLLLWIEDLQWCDRDSVEWLHYLLRFDRTARLLIVGTLRPEEITSDHPVATLLAALRRDRQVTEIAVGPLDAIGTRQLAAQVVGADLDPTRADCLYAETEGNPLFIIETLRAEAACAEAGALPATVQAVITTRLAQLSESARALMELAATIGRAFTFEILRQAHDADEAALVRSLDELWQRRIIREAGASAYDFSHGKLREVAYAGLSSARKRFLHRRVGEALISIYPDGGDHTRAQIATHFQQAGLAERASTYYRRAAEAARHIYANQEAINYLNQALELTPDSAHERYALLLAREATWDVQGQRDAQARDLAELQQLAQALNDDSKQAEVCVRQAKYAEAISDYAAASEHAQAAIHRARLAQRLDQESIGYLVWGRSLWQQGDCQPARLQLKHALELAHAAHLSDVEADSLYNLSCVAEFEGRHQAACEYAEQALDYYRRAGDRRGEIRALNSLGVDSLALNNHVPARLYFDQVLRLCRETGDRRSEGIVLRNLGGLADSLGDYATAQSCYEQSLVICRAIGERRSESETLTYLGLLYHQLSDDERAYTYCQQAVRLARRVAAKYEQATALTHLGDVLLGQGRSVEAARVYEQSLNLRREMGNASLALEPLGGLAATSLVQGDLALAVTQVEEILTYLTHHRPDELDEPFKVYLICYRVLQAAHDPRAATILKTAYDLLHAQADRLPDPALRRTFLENVPEHRALVHAWNERP